MKEVPDIQPINPRVLRRRAAAMYLGFKSPRTLDGLGLRQVQIGQEWGYDVRDLDRYIDTAPKRIKRAG